MSLKSRPTAFGRFFVILLIMAAIFFGVQYALTSTDWGKEIHQEVIESVPEQN